MAPGLVMRSHAFDCRIVLRDVKIERPWSQRIRHRLESLIENGLLLPLEVLRQNPVLGRVIAEGIEKRMRHIRLKAERLWSTDFFEQVDHISPAVHSAPA